MSIESDFLKVIKQRAEFLNSEDWLATELAGKMERFFKWAIDEQEVFIGDLSQKYIINDNPKHEKFNTLSDLYQYWLENVEGK